MIDVRLPIIARENDWPIKLSHQIRRVILDQLHEKAWRRPFYLNEAEQALFLHHCFQLEQEPSLIYTYMKVSDELRRNPNKFQRPSDRFESKPET